MEMQDVKYMFQEMNSFNGFIDNLIETQKRISELKNSAVEISENETYRKKKQ